MWNSWWIALVTDVDILAMLSAKKSCLNAQKNINNVGGQKRKRHQKKCMPVFRHKKECLVI